MNMFALVVAWVIAFQNAPTGVPGTTSGYPSIQAALDAQPGKVLYVLPGDYEISEAIAIRSDGGGLTGTGRIIQTNPDASILEVVKVKGARVEGITLTRPEGKQDATKHGLHAVECLRFTADNVRVENNRSAAGTIFLEHCTDSTVRNCTVLNYKRITIDDRTETPNYGYAFKAIDGTGIMATFGTGITILNNFVLDENIYPTEETKTKYDLGKLTDGKKPTNKGLLAPQGDYASNWHQGSAITVTSPEVTTHVLISGNVIRNAAQGIDMHADHLTCTNNVIDHAFIGLKCMHGAKNVIISNNNVSHMDLWGLVMLPGTISHPAEAAKEGQEAHGPNFTSGNIISNNIFADFGFGYEYFNWKDHKDGVISLQSGQLKENPVMTDVLITGNIVYDTGKDQVLENGQPVIVGPRYEYAVKIADNPPPQGLRFSNNLFQPGRSGISNVELKE